MLKTHEETKFFPYKNNPKELGIEKRSAFTWVKTRFYVYFTLALLALMALVEFVTPAQVGANINTFVGILFTVSFIALFKALFESFGDYEKATRVQYASWADREIIPALLWFESESKEILENHSRDVEGYSKFDNPKRAISSLRDGILADNELRERYVSFLSRSAQQMHARSNKKSMDAGIFYNFYAHRYDNDLPLEVRYKVTSAASTGIQAEEQGFRARIAWFKPEEEAMVD